MGTSLPARGQLAGKAGHDDVEAWVIGPTANGFGGKENGAVVLSQGGSGHHGKETMGRRGTTGEPTELVNWQNVGEVRKREESIRIQLVWVGESGMNRTPNKGFSVNSVSALRVGTGLTAL